MSDVEATMILILLFLPILIAFWGRIVSKQTTELDTPSVKPDLFDLQALETYPHRPFSQSGKYHMTMGLRKLDVENWLTVDKNYMTQHRIRAGLLADKKMRVLQCLPGSEDACVEVLDLIVDYLTRKYPAMYQVFEGADSIQKIRNTETGEDFGLKPPFQDMGPLEIAARLVCEDISLLKKCSDGGEHHLYISTIEQCQ